MVCESRALGECLRRMLERLALKAAARERPSTYPLGYAEGLNDARTPHGPEASRAPRLGG